MLRNFKALDYVMSLKTSLSMYRNLLTGIRGEYSISAEVV